MSKEKIISLLNSLKIKEEDMWNANDGNYTNRDLWEAKNDMIDVCIDVINFSED